MPYTAVYLFEDNNGGKAKVRAYFDGSQAQAASASLALAARLADISSAKLVSFTLSVHVTTSGFPEAQSTSNIGRVGILFYRNGDDTASFYLPSIAGLPVDASGPYAGRRITRDAVGLSGMLASLDNLLVGALDPARRLYGSVFSVAVITGEV